jgi:hypothetical protein
LFGAAITTPVIKNADAMSATKSLFIYTLPFAPAT